MARHALRAPAGRTPPPVRALVVDDEPTLAELLSMALRYEGWEVRTAGDGLAAVRTGREFRPDVVVLDVMLPDVDGFEVLRRLRAEAPELPVLFLTARDAVEDRVAGITAGGDDYVTKPFSLEEVVARLRGLLRRAAVASATARRVAELPLERGEVELAERVPPSLTDTRSEVEQVGAAFNRVLGHVEGALGARQDSETRLRRFVADASHELRTPLAAIRGYAELAARRADDMPPEMAGLLDRVGSQTGRMTALVEDLLLLARLDAGRPLAREPVDLARVVVDAVTDAHAAAPEHR